MTDKHDFAGALEEFNYLYPPINKGGNSAMEKQRVLRETIAFALRLAEKVCGEVSDEVEVSGIEASLLGRPSIDDPEYINSIFNAMRTQLIKEIEDDR